MTETGVILRYWTSEFWCAHWQWGPSPPHNKWINWQQTMEGLNREQSCLIRCFSVHTMHSAVCIDDGIPCILLCFIWNTYSFFKSPFLFFTYCFYITWNVGLLWHASFFKYLQWCDSICRWEFGVQNNAKYTEKLQFGCFLSLSFLQQELSACLI